MNGPVKLGIALFVAVPCVIGLAFWKGERSELPIVQPVDEITIPVEESSTPVPDEPLLARGREVYIENCENCHRRGKAGAPKMTVVGDWAPRIAKGKEILIEHALRGYESPAGHEMPARGGNDELTDDEVIAAVAYIIERSRN